MPTSALLTTDATLQDGSGPSVLSRGGMLVLASALADCGFQGFDDFWKLPHVWVDAVNYRHGGWSATSRLELIDGRQREVYYVKRQQNQLKRSLDAPWSGVLTYVNEAIAITSNQQFELPSVELSGMGVRNQDGRQQGILITRALDVPSLAELKTDSTDWRQLLPLLRHAGHQLFLMHRRRISHGALYPHHLFINRESGEINLIDFERSRRCLTVNGAIRRDLRQFIRRAGWMPDTALEALLSSHLQHYPRLTRRLLSACRKEPPCLQKTTVS